MRDDDESVVHASRRYSGVQNLGALHSNSENMEVEKESLKWKQFLKGCDLWCRGPWSRVKSWFISPYKVEDHVYQQVASKESNRKWLHCHNESTPPAALHALSLGRSGAFASRARPCPTPRRDCERTRTDANGFAWRGRVCGRERTRGRRVVAYGS